MNKSSTNETPSPDYSDFAYRMYRPGDEEALNHIYYLITGRIRDFQKFSWQWLETPYADSVMWVIYEKKTKEVVGHHGLLPMKMSYRGKPLMMGMTENSMMHPRYRGRGIYSQFEKKFILEELGGRFDLLLTRASGGASVNSIRRSLGYQPFSSWTQFAFFTERRSLAAYTQHYADKTFKRKIPGLVFQLSAALPTSYEKLRSAFSKRPSSGVSFEEFDFEKAELEEVDMLWEKSKESYGVTAWRSGEFYKYLLHDNPYKKGTLLRAKKSGETVGYAAIGKNYSVGEKAKLATITDMFVLNNSPRVLEDAVYALIELLLDKGYGMIVARSSPSDRFLTAALTKAGFFKLSDYPFLKRFGSPWMLKVVNPDLDQKELLDPQNWYVTNIFGEGVRWTGRR